MQNQLLGLIAVCAVSLISLAGIMGLSLSTDKLRRVLFILVSLSAGTMIGSAFLHLIPEAIEMEGADVQGVFFLIIAGILAFFALEKIVCWRHCHIPTNHEHPHPLAIMNLLGDALHNFIDGAAIAASFLIDVRVGISTTIAVILHEIPQEIGDFGVLLHAGYTRKKALLVNFITALTALAGLLFVFTLDATIDNIEAYLSPIAAGGFIYIASADLIPELKKEIGLGKSILQLITIALGIAIISFI